MSNPIEGTRTLLVERVFPHSTEKLWRALTTTPLLAQWLLENDFEPTVGRRFQFRNEPMPHWDGAIDCEVLIVEPLRKLAYTWNALGLESVVTFTLSTVEGGTRVRMEQSGFLPEQEAAYKGASYGWQKFFGSLKRVLDGADQ